MGESVGGDGNGGGGPLRGGCCGIGSWLGLDELAVAWS